MAKPVRSTNCRQFNIQLNLHSLPNGDTIMSDNLFIGDLHLGHRNILKYRTSFDSIEEHDGIIVAGLRSKASKRNVLWLMGDCFFDADWTNFAVELVQSYGKVNLILGNHCTEKPERMQIIKLLVNFDNVDIHGLHSRFGMWLSHCPIHPQEMRKRVANIHGHLHHNIIDDPRYINVSCEHVDFKPISLQDIRNIIEDRGLKQ